MSTDTGKLRMPMTTEVLDVLDENDVIPMSHEFRFSASYANRYHKCHGSANLEEAIPGFQYPERNDDGWKGVGTQLHEIFADAVSPGEGLREKAKFLREISERRDRIKLLSDKKAYIVWWFMLYKVAPPIAYEIAVALVYQVPVKDASGSVTGTRDKAVEPRYVVAMAEAIEYVADLIDTMDADSLEILVEVKTTAEWLSTKPKTTVDLVIKDKYVMHVLDLKMGEIEIDATNNTQLMYYAWTFGGVNYPEVKLHIMQRNNTNDWTISFAKLHEWSNEMKESERAILGGDKKLTPGGHCTFCPANPHSRSDKGSKACPAMLTMLYGERDEQQSDIDVLEGD
jgi:hypothetical protein